MSRYTFFCFARRPKHIALQFFLCILLLFLILFSFPNHSAGEKQRFVLSVQPAFSATDSPDAAKVDYWYTSGDKRYFFLPAFFNPESLQLTIRGADSILIDNTEYHNGDIISLPLNRDLKVSGKNVPSFTLIVMRSANIPTLFIETESGNMDYVHKKKGNRESGKLLAIDADGTIEFNDNMDYIRGRGNSTFNYVKKPYQIKLKTAASLCGLSPDKTFVLLANYLDRSEIRNTIAFDLARYSGAYSYVPAGQSIDLYLNHSYVGCYFLVEKCEIDSNRLNITNLEKSMEKMNSLPLNSCAFSGDKYYGPGMSRCYSIPFEPEDITGGYLILANNKDYYRSEPSGFVTSHGQPFTVDQPKYCSNNQISYLRSIMQEIENGLFSRDGRDPQTGRHFSDILDMKSFVNRYLQSETLMDYDGQRPYFYKDSDTVDGKVYCAPVWDQDNILGVSVSKKAANKIAVENDYKRYYYWFPRAMKHQDCRDAIIDTYYRIYRPAYLILLGEMTDSSGILCSVDTYTEEVRFSADMDHVRWSKTYWAKSTGANTRIGNTPDSCASYLKEFIRTHMNAMDKAYPEKVR